jgi:hypothetical protein
MSEARQDDGLTPGPPPQWTSDATMGRMSRRERYGVSRRLARALHGAATARACLEALGEPELAHALPASADRELLLGEARHQADLLGHPYLGPEHVRLAALRVLGRRDQWLTLHGSLPSGLPGHGWRPRGPLSAARRAGRRRTARRQVAAIAAERGRRWPEG